MRIEGMTLAATADRIRNGNLTPIAVVRLFLPHFYEQVTDWKDKRPALLSVNSE